MIPSGVQIFLALEPVDMRWSFDRLSAYSGQRDHLDRTIVIAGIGAS